MTHPHPTSTTLEARVPPRPLDARRGCTPAVHAASLRWAARILALALLVLPRPSAMAAVGALSALDADPADADYPHPVVAAVEQLLNILDHYDLHLDPIDGVRRTVLALAQVADPGARLLTEAERAKWQDYTQGHLIGVGLQLTRSNLQTRVADVVAGSPAAEAGLKAGDTIAAVNDKDATLLNIAELRTALRGADAQGVSLALQKDGDEEERLTLEPRRLPFPAVDEADLLPTGLGYIRVNGLYPGSGESIVDQVAAWQPDLMSGLVLDLRGANGRDLASVVAVASMLAAPGAELFSFRRPNGNELAAYDAQPAQRLGMPVMVLIDENTTGAAEVLAGVLAASTKGAMLIGRRTAGDPMIREPVELRPGLWVYLATKEFVNPDGTAFDGGAGIQPDIRVAPHSEYSDYPEPEPPILTDRRETTEREIATGELRARIRGDAPLTRAVDVLLGLKALNLLQVGHDGVADR